jgi:hypothetical protein
MKRAHALGRFAHLSVVNALVLPNIEVSGCSAPIVAVNVYTYKRCQGSDPFATSVSSSSR